MSRNTKIILGIAGGAVVLLSVCACITVLVATVLLRNSSISVSPERAGADFREAVQVQPDQAESAGAVVTELTLPAGWRSDYSMRIAGFRLVGYKPESGAGHIMLAVLPETTDRSIDEWQQELQGLGNTHGFMLNRSEMTVVERKPITVKGQATEMIIAEGSGSSGVWRQALTSFRGDQGLTLVIYGMPKDSYSQADVDMVFASIW